MGYQVLARKWRPHNFQEMVGQEHILRMLTNALDNQRLHHAYLFTGTRGVGKTTLGRILAKCLNCETGITSKPCGTCATCQAVDVGRFLDLLEIDAASRTKVEDTRDLLENVQYAPSQGRYKIYLIDEVHMLSGHSFNALLKTLEEPPAHVIFLLATTDPKRLPVTILSRCLQFNLKRVPVEQISQHLAHICTAENLSFELPALEQLANAADGSLRDALSILDQAIAFCGNHLDNDNVRRMLGNIEQDYVARLLFALAENDGKKLLHEVTLLSEQAPDFQQLLANILALLHQIAVLQIVPGTEASTTTTTLATQLSAEDIQLYYQIALLGKRDLALAPNPKAGFEMVMLRMLAFKPTAHTQSISKSTPAKATTQKPATIIEPRKAETSKLIETPSKKIETILSSSTTITEASEWTVLIDQLDLSGMSLALATNCALISLTDNSVTLALSTKHEPMLSKKLTERLEEALNRYFNKTMSLTIQVTDSELDTSAKQQEQATKARHEVALDAITKDNHVQKIMNVFDATLDMTSVKPIDSV